jgi:hypothetical protein
LEKRDPHGSVGTTGGDDGNAQGSDAGKSTVNDDAFNEAIELRKGTMGRLPAPGDANGG